MDKRETSLRRETVDLEAVGFPSALSVSGVLSMTVGELVRYNHRLALSIKEIELQSESHAARAMYWHNVRHDKLLECISCRVVRSDKSYR